MTNLNDIQKKDPFRIPDNYFEEVNRKIITATSGYENEFTKPAKIRKLRPYFQIAASVAGFIILSYTAFTFFSSGNDKILSSEYVQDSYSESVMNELDILNIEERASNMVLAEEGPDVNRKDIIEYLILENIEISDIYEQL